MLRPAGYAMGISCGSLTTGGLAWLGWLSTKPSGLGWRSCPPGRGTTRTRLTRGFAWHGNPNVLTADLPSSTLSQGCTGQLALVEIEAYRGTPPELSVTRPPATA